MRNWLSLFPAVVFFGVYFVTDDFRTATMALIAGVFLQILGLFICGKKPKPMEWTALGLITVFGGATLLLQENIYLQIKTTVVNWLFALCLLVADFVLKKNLARILMGEFFTASDVLWRRVSLLLAGMFFIIGAANLIIINLLSEAAWVYAKTFGYPAFTFIMLIGVIAYLLRHATPRQ